MPGLQETLPFYATAAQTILPIALGVSGFACILAIFVVPGRELDSQLASQPMGSMGLHHLGRHASV